MKMVRRCIYQKGLYANTNQGSRLCESGSLNRHGICGMDSKQVGVELDPAVDCAGCETAGIPPPAHTSTTLALSVSPLHSSSSAHRPGSGYNQQTVPVHGGRSRNTRVKGRIAEGHSKRQPADAHPQQLPISTRI